MKGKYFVLLFYFALQKLFCQSISYVIVDSFSKKAVENVHIFYKSTKDGTISNSEGLVSLPILDDTLIISSLNYEQKLINPIEYNLSDTILLSPIVYDLPVVNFSFIDIEEKINHILDNYDKLYDTNTYNYYCTYKESYKIEDQLRRLVQGQIIWQNSYKWKPESLDKQMSIKLKSTDYSHVVLGDDAPSSLSLTNNSFFSLIHLNSLLKTVLLNIKKLDIYNIFSSGDLIVINLENDHIIQNQEESFILKSAVISLDTLSGGISHINCTFLSNYVRKQTQNQQKYLIKGKEAKIQIDFDYIKQKLTLSNGKITSIGSIESNNLMQHFSEEQILIVHQKNENVRIKRRERLNLERHLWTSFPEKKTETIRFPLNSEEKTFLQKNGIY